METGLAGKSKQMGANMVAEVIGIMFMSRTYAHMAHLKTGSYAKHKALNRFYDDVVDMADKLAEVGQGQWGKLDIPFVKLEGEVTDPIVTLEAHLTKIKRITRGCDMPYIDNIFQEIEALYRKTLYLLRELA